MMLDGVEDMLPDGEGNAVLDRIEYAERNGVKHAVRP